MTRPPCVRLCPAYPGNPRTRIEGESPPFRKGTYGLRCALLRASKDDSPAGGRFILRGSPKRLAPQDDGDSSNPTLCYSTNVVSCAPSSATNTAINSAGSVLLALAETRCTAPGGSKNDCPTLKTSTAPPASCDRISPLVT